MQRFLKSIFIFSLVAVGFLAFSAKAEAAGNVVGYAWSDSTGWISMNCNNSALPAGFNVSTCPPGADYGVTLDMTTGAMSGYGWSDNVGWIKFDPVPPNAPLYPSNPSSPTKISSPSTPGIHAAAGWARFCSNVNQAILPDNCIANTNGITPQNGGWNGWVSMKGTNQSGTPFGVTYNGTTGEFGGFAWGGTTNAAGSEVVGWISFTGVKIPVQNYVPVVSLAGGTPILAGGDTFIIHRWQNADNNPQHQFVSCQAFTSRGLVVSGNSVDVASGSVGNWDSRLGQETFPFPVPPAQTPFPSTNFQTVNFVFAYAPTTTYYLACRTAGGQYAADPSNPTTQCNLSTPATVQATCPRTTVATLQPSFPLQILDEAVPGVWSSTQIFDVPGNVSLRWTFPAGANNCRGYAAQPGITNWPLQSNLGMPKTQAGSPETGIVVASPRTDYFMSCALNGQFVYSNRVTAFPKAPITIPSLAGRPNGSNGGYSANFSVNTGEKVQLRASSQLIGFNNCSAITRTTIQPGGWQTGLTKPDITAPLYGWTEPIPINVPDNPTRFAIRCQHVGTGAWVESNDVIVNVNQVVVPKLTLQIKLNSLPVAAANYGPSVLVPVTDSVALHWEANVPISSNTCRASSSSPGSTPNQYWNGPLVLPAPLPGAVTTTPINLERVDNVATTYTITCAPQDGSPDLTGSAIAISLPQLGPALSIDTIPGCVKTDQTLFNLGWNALNLSGGTCTLSNNTGVTNSNGATVWDGTTSINSNNAGATVTNMHINSDTRFTLSCVSSAGTAYGPIHHDVVINPTCTDAPRRNWFFQFFER